MSITTDTITLPTAWALALVHGDYSCLEHDAMLDVSWALAEAGFRIIRNATP